MSEKTKETRKRPIPLENKAYKVADVKKRENSESELICSAVANGDFDTVNLLLSQGSSAVNDSYENGDTLLHIASNRGHSEIVELLLKHGARINRENYEGFPPLHVAIMAGKLEVVKLILNASLFNGKYTLIEVRNKSRGASCNCTPLHMAAACGSQEIIQFLINCGANINAKMNNYRTPLHLSVQKMHAKCVKQLLEYSGNLSVKEDHRIIYLAARGSCRATNFEIHSILRMSKWRQLKCTNIIDILLDTGAKFHDDVFNDYNGLIFAARHDRYWIVKKLLECGFNVNSRKENSRTALHEACKYASSDVVSILLKAGADVTLEDAWGNVPIYFAVRNHNYKILSLLINAGADINAKRSKGYLMLNHILIDYRDILFNNTDLYLAKDVYMFLKYGLDLSVSDFSNANALLRLCAVFYRNEYSGILLDCFLHFNIFNKTPDESPIWWLFGKSKIMVEKFIIKVMAKIVCDNKFKFIDLKMYIEKHTEMFPGLYEKCQRELEILKNQKFWGEITFYDLLNRPLETLRGYTCNSELMQIFNSCVWNSFPLYGQIMKSRLSFARKLRQLHEMTVNKLNELVYPIKIPRYISFNILSLLNVDDMEKILSMKINNVI